MSHLECLVVALQKEEINILRLAAMTVHER